MAIISFSRKFIFVKTAKTGGTSIEICLARHCGPEDVVTPIFPTHSDHRPQNHLAPNGKLSYFNHMPARQIRDQIGRDRFASFFKFCFERHPVDKCLSHYAMLKNSPHHRKLGVPKSWNEYVEKAAFADNYRTYTDADGSLLVDKIYKYENMADALTDIRERTGVKDLRFDVFEKSGFRTEDIPRVEDVTASQRRRIMAAFANTLRFVDY